MSEPGASPVSSTAPPPPPTRTSEVSAAHVLPSMQRKSVWTLMMMSLGVVFGDIGTSPLYTLRECILHLAPPDKVTGVQNVIASDVFELCSMIFWSLMVVVTIKYLLFIMKLDNKGEGGIMALLALVPESLRVKPLQRLSFVAILVVIGASFLYGDGAITPAISVLSAVEGIAVAKPSLQHLVIPVTLILIIGLFMIQRRGTKLVGTLFGPVMLLWFTVLGVLGLIQIVKAPMILQALSPHYAVEYFIRHGSHGFLILGTVVLAVTGGEALYADMGHFGGVRPIRRGWLLIVLPALVLSYFGQGALVIAHPETAANPLFAQVPKGPLTFALVGLSSMATIIASQALISGSFSLTRQAMQMGLFPRVTIKHTAAEEEGQIYIPEINYALAGVCIYLVLAFKTSSAMASVYGVAVTGTMTITSIVWFIVLVTTKGWKLPKAVPLLLLFLAFDIPFVLANAFKIPAGGYVPLLLGTVVVVVMLVWHEGRRLVGKIYTTRYPSFDEAWEVISKNVAQRTPGTGVFMASADQGVPPILVHLVERTRTLHKQILLLTVMTRETPTVELKERITVDEIGHGFIRVKVNYGFMEQPDIPRAINLAVRREWLDIDPDDLTYYLARERILAGPGGEMGVVLETFFAFLSRNAVNADRYFRIPHNKVIEVGAQIDL
jgi:KUP system potassium uptake protein